MTQKVAGIVLCGGESRRMGRSKAWLPFGPEVLLQRVVRIMSEVLSPIVVVGAENQELPKLPDDIIITRDEQAALGPLAGLAAGLRALDGSTAAAYVSACDAPLLCAEFITAVIEKLGPHDIAIPRDGKYHHPLAAVYRTNVEAKIRELIAEKKLRPFFLLELTDAFEIDVEELRSVDPELASLRNSNTPEEYRAVLSAAGYHEETE